MSTIADLDGQATTDLDFVVDDDGIAVVTFNRPALLNACRARTRAELRAVFEHVRTERAVRVLILTGAGRAFSSGQDLVELGELLVTVDDATDHALQHLQELQDLTSSLLGIGKPVIAALNGVAVGLGAELALACDVRLASTAAKIGFVEAQRGLFETNGVMYLLPRIVGHGRAAELLLTGDLLDALEAERIGLVGRVVAPEALLDEAKGLARRIAANAPISVRLIKEVLRETYDRSLPEIMQLEMDGMLACLRSNDLRHGVEAFLAKRRPSYRGT
jgi:enoyl-CoA hydratase/carnithine racemase